MSGLTLRGRPTGDHSLLGNTPPPPPRVLSEEARFHYAGLPSRPVLVARTSNTPYESPTGPEAYPRRKELRIVGDHKIKDVWEDDLAFEVHAILGVKEVQWTSTDVVRIGYIDESSGSVILWIGVKPGSLSHEDGIDVALQCKGLLLDRGIDDVDVEIRESEVFDSAGPKLLLPGLDTDPTVDVRQPLTATVGMPVSPRSIPLAEGTGGFFLNEGGNGNKLLLVTARHVVLSPNKDENDLFEHKAKGLRHDVLLFSDTSFQQHLAFIVADIEAQEASIDYQNMRISKMVGRDDEVAKEERDDAQRWRERAKKGIQVLLAFHQELLTHWADTQSRILGHVLFSPPIAVGVGTEQYTQDLAVLEIDRSKIDPSSFMGNVIDLGYRFTPHQLTLMMYPNPRNRHNFEYPGDRLLSLRGTIGDAELRDPTTYDQNNDPCIMVIKRGKTTELTVGRANPIFSYVRKDFGSNQVSKEWAILPFDSKSGPFSADGDSGSVIVDGAGRIGGLLTGGARKCVTAYFDITYATPISFILKTIHGNKSLAKAYPREGPAA